MNVLHINVNFDTELHSNLVRSLSAFCGRQTVYFPSYRGRKLNYDFTGYNIDYLNHQLLNITTRIIYIWKLHVLYTDIIRHINFYDYNVIHAHTLFSDGGLAYKLSLKYDLPFIVAIRNTDINYFLVYKPWLKTFGRKILNRASKIIFISYSIKESFEKYFGEEFNDKIEVVANGIDSVFFKKSCKPKLKPNQEIQILYVGKVSINKGIYSLYKYCLKNRLKLVVVGGSKPKKLKRVKYLNNNINFLGVINNKEELADLYHQSDIFILPSSKETFGLVYIESLSQATPIIYVKNTGVDGYFYQGEVGYSINPKIESEYDFAIKNIKENYSEISQRCLLRSGDFSWEKISKCYKRIYSNIIG